MRKLTNFQNELWERYLRATETAEEAKGEVERLRGVMYDHFKEARLYASLLNREGVNVEKRLAAIAADEAKAAESENTEEPQTAAFNKTHAIIDVFRKYGESGFMPTALWQKAVDVYPDRDITRNYVNTVVGKLYARGLITKNGGGNYQLTEKGRNFVIEVGE